VTVAAAQSCGCSSSAPPAGAHQVDRRCGQPGRRGLVVWCPVRRPRQVRAGSPRRARCWCRRPRRCRWRAPRPAPLHGWTQVGGPRPLLERWSRWWRGLGRRWLPWRPVGPRRRPWPASLIAPGGSGLDIWWH